MKWVEELRIQRSEVHGYNMTSNDLFERYRRTVVN